MKINIYTKMGVLTIVVGLLFLVRIPYVNLLLAFLVVMVVALSKYDKDLSRLFFNDKSILDILLKSFLYASSLVLLSYYVLIRVIESLTNEQVNYEVFEPIKGNFNILITYLGIGWLIGGVLEEFIFRGYLLQTIENILPKKIGLLVGVLLSSIIFGWLHDYQGISGQLLTGIAGALLGLIYLFNNKNVWLNILTHGFMNTICMIFLYFN
mgnify:CR=1 FL=1